MTHKISVTLLLTAVSLFAAKSTLLPSPTGIAGPVPVCFDDLKRGASIEQIRLCLGPPFLTVSTRLTWRTEGVTIDLDPRHPDRVAAIWWGGQKHNSGRGGGFWRVVGTAVLIAACGDLRNKPVGAWDGIDQRLDDTCKQHGM